MKRKRTNRAQDRHNRQTGLERIAILFSLAEKEKLRPERASRYMFLASRIAMRYNIKMPAKLKRKYCRKCRSYFVHGLNCTVRARTPRGAVIIKCLKCNNIMRYPYRRER